MTISIEDLLSSLMTKMLDSSTPGVSAIKDYRDLENKPLKLKKSEIKKIQAENMCGQAVFNKMKFVFKKPLFASYCLLDNPVNIDKKFDRNVTKTANTFLMRFLEITSLIKREDIPNSLYTRNLLAHSAPDSYFTLFLSKAFLDMCLFFELGDQHTQKELVALSQNPFVPIPEFNHSLEEAFSLWQTLSAREKATEKRPYCFDDTSTIYAQNTESHEMIVFQGQSTIYCYIKERSSGIIKAFETVIISKKDVPYYLDMCQGQKVSYADFIFHLLSARECPWYPVSLDHLSGYLKSPAYYLEHFSSDENIIYDTTRGYNVHSFHSYNLISDVEIMLLCNSDGRYDS